MKINTNELEKLSIADMLALSDYLFTTSKPSQIDIRIASALTYEIGQRIARLTIEESEFDFKEWLASDGWSSVFTDCHKKPNKHEKDTFFRILLFPSHNIMELGVLDSKGHLIKEIIKDGCLIPSSEQEAETLFKLFEL